ncbi:MAG TPA: malto-oligosyltrehalose synthase [Gemmataceae bacterium]|jgi:(1->4)-alpha-D-glucan 1-alpha-D-glucosylmutase
MTSAEVLANLLSDVEREATARRCTPEATYRLQFHAGFTFQDAAHLASYLHDLGISHVYASPYLKARTGSKHGYDVLDHQHLNPEIGSDADYAAYIDALHRHGLGQILDVVPNHMGIVGNENIWWNDVLENGPSSPYANFFDIAWQASPRPVLSDRVLLPLLGDPYGQVLEAGQIRLRYEAGVFTLHYYEHRLPLAPCTWSRILGHNLDKLEATLGKDSPPFHEYQSILTAVRNLPARNETSAERIAERQREKEVIKRRLAVLTDSCAEVREHLHAVVALFNGAPGDAHSFDLLDELLDDQAYRLSSWRVASDEINYRRFFDINELAALRMERSEVFTATHALIFQLVRDRKVNGLRIDHPDGLFDPRQYLRRLQRHYLLELARQIYQSRPEYQQVEWSELEGPLLVRINSGALPERSLYVVVEKILGSNEPLPADWPVHGTTGYDFLNVLGGLFVDPTAARIFTTLYRDWIEDYTPFGEVIYQKKLLILSLSLSSELQMLSLTLDRLAQRRRWSRDFTLNSLRRVLREVIACFPVYRSYIAGGTVHDDDRKYIDTAIRDARRRNPTLNRSHFQFLRNILLLRYDERAGDDEIDEQQRFAGQFQQVTSPVMAKGLEDTAFYVYNRLTSLNEVGGDPGRFGIPPSVVHQDFAARQQHWPRALSTTSTHDSKRSEDVRARISVLSEIADAWIQRLHHWSVLNEPHRVQVEEEKAPDSNVEYLLYQTLLGAWPPPHPNPPPQGGREDGSPSPTRGEGLLSPSPLVGEGWGGGSAEEYATFVGRIQAYMEKATHEAKVHTSWINPNADYDQALRQFVGRILDPAVSREFLDDLQNFQQRISRYGFFNSLSQCLLKITAPGAPDVYQGTELWDFSLVDPDNRRPVDYEKRRQLLADLLERSCPATGRGALADELVDSMTDGRIKMYVTALALRCRRAHPGLFSVGSYSAVEPVGTRAEHVFSFIRRHHDRAVLAAAPRLIAKLLPDFKGVPLGSKIWGETMLPLPEELGNRIWRSVFTGETLKAVSHQGRPTLPAAQVFARFPVALLLDHEEPVSADEEPNGFKIV